MFNAVDNRKPVKNSNGSSLKRWHVIPILGVAITAATLLMGFISPGQAVPTQTTQIPLDGMTISGTTFTLSGSVHTLIHETGQGGSTLTIRTTLQKVSFTDGTVTCKVTGNGTYQGTTGPEADFTQNYPVVQSADCPPTDLVLQYQFSFDASGNETNVVVTPLLTKHA